MLGKTCEYVSSVTVEELQSRLETILLPDGHKNIQKLVITVINELELVIYCNELSEQRALAESIMSKLIADIDEEIE